MTKFTRTEKEIFNIIKKNGRINTNVLKSVCKTHGISFVKYVKAFIGLLDKEAIQECESKSYFYYEVKE